MNSVPKSGTHLLKYILQGIPGVSHDPKNEFYEGYSYQLKNHYFKLSHLKPNEFAVGHVFYSPEWLSMLKRLNMKHIEAILDVVVSFVYFIIEKYPYHPLMSIYQRELRNKNKGIWKSKQEAFNL